MLQNTSNQGCAQGLKCFKGSADQVLLQAYTCVLRYDKTRGFTQGATVTKGFADHLLLRAHTCVLQNTSTHSCTEGFHEAWPTKFCWENTHVCARTQAFKVAAKAQRQLLLLLRADTHTLVLQKRSIEGCTQGSRVTNVWPLKFCCEHTHVSCRNQGCT